MSKKVNFDTLRSLAHGSISGSYAAIGSALTHTPKQMVITNATDGDMIISDDNTNATGKMFMPAGSSRIYDFTSNAFQKIDDDWVMEIGTIMYAKQSSAPPLGGVYLEYVYGT